VTTWQSTVGYIDSSHQLTDEAFNALIIIMRRERGSVNYTAIRSNYTVHPMTPSDITAMLGNTGDISVLIFTPI